MKVAITAILKTVGLFFVELNMKQFGLLRELVNQPQDGK